MTPMTNRARRAANSSDAMVAAYIHEISERHLVAPRPRRGPERRSPARAGRPDGVALRRAREAAV